MFDWLPKSITQDKKTSMVRCTMRNHARGQRKNEHLHQNVILIHLFIKFKRQICFHLNWKEHVVFFKYIFSFKIGNFFFKMTFFFQEKIVIFLRKNEHTHLINIQFEFRFKVTDRRSQLTFKLKPRLICPIWS